MGMVNRDHNLNLTKNKLELNICVSQHLPPEGIQFDDSGWNISSFFHTATGLLVSRKS